MGTMNVGKVSFGNAQPTGAAQGAAKQPAPVKKADKGDVVVIGGKEVKKSTLVKGGVIATAVAALGTAALAMKRGKGLNEAKAAIDKANGGAEGEKTKLFQNIKDGFKTFFGEGNKEYKATLEKAKGLAENGDKGSQIVTGEGTKPVGGETPEPPKAPTETPTQQPEAPAAGTGKEEVKTTSEQAAGRTDKSQVTAQDLIKAQGQANAAEKQVQILQNKLQNALNNNELASVTTNVVGDKIEVTQVLKNGTKISPDGSFTLADGTIFTKTEQKGQKVVNGKNAEISTTVWNKKLPNGTSAVATEDEVKFANNLRSILSTDPGSAPKTPVKPVAPTEVKEPKVPKILKEAGFVKKDAKGNAIDVTEPMRTTKKGGKVALSKVDEKQLTDVEKKQLDAFKAFNENKSKYAQYQTDLANYNNNILPKYKADLTEYNKNMAQYKVQLGAFERYQNATEQIDAAKGRLESTKGHLSELQKSASRETKRAVAGLNNKTLADLEKQVQDAMDAFNNLPKNASEKTKANLQERLANAQDRLAQYEQAFNK